MAKQGRESAIALNFGNGEATKLHFQSSYPDSEIVIGLVAAVGTDLEHVAREIVERLKAFRYNSKEIKISRDIIPVLRKTKNHTDHFARIDNLMSTGNRLRKDSGENSILALAAAASINEFRIKASSGAHPAAFKKQAFIISSLKHPDEVEQLRKIYSNGFFLIGIHSTEERRTELLTKRKFISEDKAKLLIQRDQEENEPFGQHTRDTYHLSDFFVNLQGNLDKFQNDIWRVIDLIFGKPFVTPTFDEFAMFMAFSSSLRSADLSRQVGAVIAKNKNIISTGANDVPKSGGGLYWPHYDQNNTKIEDEQGGRDYMRGGDTNVLEKNAIISDILERASDSTKRELKKLLKSSKIKNITEYGRAVHAEMEALLACGRSKVGTVGATLYSTTYPCHNCAKHIIAAGIKRVVYVEPYPKSKAYEFHSDSLSHNDSNKVLFEPFVGVGPRSFFNLFSMNLGSGYKILRKLGNGNIVDWKESTSSPRMKLTPSSYIEREQLAAVSVLNCLEKLK